MKTIPNSESLKQLQDSNVEYLINGKPMRPGEAFITIISSYHQVINPQRDEPVGVMDSHYAGRLLEKSNDPVLKLEDADYEWLKKVIETYAPRIFGAVGGEIIIRAVKCLPSEEEDTDTAI